MAVRVNHYERKREIIHKSIHLFSQVGYDNVSLIMIANAAGVARTVLYRYFCSKREVLDAAIRDTISLIMDECKTVAETEKTYARKLEAVCGRMAEIFFVKKEFLIAICDFVIAMVRSGADMTGRVADFTSIFRELFSSILVKGKECREFSKELDVERVTDSVYSHFESLAIRIMLGSERDPSAAKARFADVIAAISV